jgi:hypothetical protein
VLFVLILIPILVPILIFILLPISFAFLLLLFPSGAEEATHVLAPPSAPALPWAPPRRRRAAAALPEKWKKMVGARQMVHVVAAALNRPEPPSGTFSRASAREGSPRPRSLPRRAHHLASAYLFWRLSFDYHRLVVASLYDDNKKARTLCAVCQNTGRLLFFATSPISCRKLDVLCKGGNIAIAYVVIICS